MVSAHLIHGSSEGRFSITYAVNPGLMSKEEIENVGYQYMELGAALERYPIDRLENGFQTMQDGEEIYVVKAPAVGLWRG